MEVCPGGSWGECCDTEVRALSSIWTAVSVGGRSARGCETGLGTVVRSELLQKCRVRVDIVEAGVFVNHSME